MKKKILVVFYSSGSGGILSSLMNLLKNISKNKDLQIDFLCFSQNKDLLLRVPKDVRLIKTTPQLAMLGMSQKEAFQKSFFYGFLRLILSVFSKIFSSAIPRKILFSSMKETESNIYDIAISFTHDSGHLFLGKGCNDFVLHNTKAKKKITFVHCDYEHSESNNKTNLSIYPKFDCVACVSGGCKLTFLRFFPDLASKTFVVENLVDDQNVRLLASLDPIVYNKEVLNIVSICRLSSEKGLDRVISILNKLLLTSPKIHWTIIGSGPEKDNLINSIHDLKLDAYITLIPDTPNPFRYLTNADLLLVPSRHECAPMVIYEAMTIHVPVLSTKTISADEMVIQNGSGIICENTEEGIYSALVSIIKNPSILNVYRANSFNISEHNKKALSEFYHLLEI
jgi:glycosyltransferase involved in cell wall biosynthesis